MRKVVWSAGIRLAGVMMLVLFSASCGEQTRQGQSSSYLIIGAFEGASGAEPTEFSGTLGSDVLTMVDGVPTIFNDIGRVQFLLGLKDPGSQETPLTPTRANHITVNRYHVKFIRADGRNTPGVDVPYEFDGAFTVTVSNDATVSFTIVRHQAKIEAPLAALAATGLFISTIAEVTFYGHDQTGREVSATAHISINFANFGDPE